MNYFTLGVAFLNFDIFNGLQGASSMRRFQMFQSFRDLRLKMGYQILSLWSHLGDLKQHFIPGEIISQDFVAMKLWKNAFLLLIVLFSEVYFLSLLFI